MSAFAGTSGSGFDTLVGFGSEVAAIKESRHFYSVLFYFRFAESYYSVWQSTTMILDTASLLKSSIDDDEYGWLKESAALAQCWHGSMVLLQMLDDVFLQGRAEEADTAADAATRDRWRTRYFAALDRIWQAGIKPSPIRTKGRSFTSTYGNNGTDLSSGLQQCCYTVPTRSMYRRIVPN